MKQNVSIFLFTQILREFYAVVTSSKFLVKALPPELAKKQIDFFISSFSILPVSVSEISICTELCARYNNVGQKIHDTNIVATMLSNDIEVIITCNKKDFALFKEIKSYLPS
jgi:predicted nucleic acid-binding protein